MTAVTPPGGVSESSPDEAQKAAAEFWYALRNESIVALVDRAEWSREIVAMLWGVTPERIAQIVSKARDQARQAGTPVEAPRDEYAQQMAGGGMHVRNPDPGIEKFWPLAEWIPAMRQHGGHVYRRRIQVLDDWAEIDDQGAPL